MTDEIKKLLVAFVVVAVAGVLVHKTLPHGVGADISSMMSFDGLGVLAILALAGKECVIGSVRSLHGVWSQSGPGKSKRRSPDNHVSLMPYMMLGLGFIGLTALSFCMCLLISLGLRQLDLDKSNDAPHSKNQTLVQQLPTADEIGRSPAQVRVDNTKPAGRPLSDTNTLSQDLRFLNCACHQ